jgi:hypothetical protein
VDFDRQNQFRLLQFTFQRFDAVPDSACHAACPAFGSAKETF